ncbi:MAG: DUF6383 domain-containing protein [Bacteroidales bacterium]|nr:DUF6383 domain-containing protein [Parabacteroides sp.]MDY5623069.1 DUF6383 domain-containing protein [Bacteroidales bacterium]
MNKKFSTLMAGLLLAGGMFSAANASDWTADKTYVQNTGKYFGILKAQSNNNGGSWISRGEYLTYNSSSETFDYVANCNDKNSYWTITTRKVNGATEYQLTNANGVVFKYNKVEWFRVEYATNGQDVNQLYYFDDNNAKVYLEKSGYRYGFSNNEIAEEAISATELNSMLTKNAFGLIIGSAKDKEYTDLQGNVFTGEIEAKAATSGTYYFYRKADKKYIVLTKNVWSENTANLDGKKKSAYAGYKFEAISEHAFGLLTPAQKIAQAEFQVFKSYDFNDTDSLIVTLPNACVGEMPGASTGVANWKGDVNSANANKDKGVRLFVSNVDNKNYLTVIEYAKANDRLAKQKDDAYASYQVGASVPYVKLGASNIVDFAKTFAGKIWNITDKDGKVLSPNVNWEEADAIGHEFDPATQVQLNKPEGHWLPYYTNASDYGFVNRESGETWNLYDGWVIRTTDTPNLYEIYNSKYWSAAYRQAQVYITEAKDAELGKTENGYANYDAAVEALNGKYISLTNAVTGETAYVGKDADDNVILTKDESKAIEFRIKDLKHNYTDHDGLAGIDTLQHITPYLAKADGTIKQDTVQFYHYRLFEHFSEKYLVYDTQNKKYKLSDYSITENAHEDFRAYKWDDTDYAYFSTFVLKEKDDNTYNLISNYDVMYDDCNHAGTGASTSAEFDNDFSANLYNKDNSEKMYGAFQTGTLANMAYIYNYNDNDRFTVENISTPEYMTITGSQDTVKISLEAKPNFFLYEQGKNGTNFLGMEHIADVKDMKSAILVDTAYVRNNTFKPQYLLGVDTKIVKPIYDNAGHLLEPDTVYGRFLINAVDSAYAYGINKKSNPYIWDRNDYYRLVFVDGYHTGDALTLHTGKADTKIALNNNNDKVCTFAFRYVDEAREGVKIETAYGPADANGNRSRGWLKYQNNVPVVTNDYEDAHVFLIDNTTADAPTANENISAGNVVVAGVNGAVVVKGAEGKNVIVSTILGKVVANEVVSSDNATIAAPQGVVVVSVDGESFKVVVK